MDDGNRGSCLLPGTDPDWLLLARRTQSTVTVDITQGMMLCRAPAHTEPRPVRELSPTRVLSACIGKNQLPRENEHGGDKEGG